MPTEATHTPIQHPDFPYLAAAFLCQYALTDKETHSISAIQIIDQLVSELPPGANADGITAFFGNLSVNLVVGFRSGGFTGSKDLVLKTVAPDGEVIASAPYPMQFEGGHTGAFAKLTIPIPLQLRGLLWIEVYLDDHFYTRVPLNIVRQFELTDSRTDSPTRATEGQ